MTRKRLTSGLFEILAILSAASAVTFVFYREFFLSRLDAITGDPGDARLYIAVLEHWRAVLSGHASLASPNFFAPQTGVLGYSDCLFLYVPEFLTLRALGCDRYLAFQLTLIALRLIGFFALYFLLRRKLALAWFPALTGASLFSISHLYFYSAGHPQLAAIAFVPLLALLLFHYFESPARRAFSLWSASALLAFLFLTGYYIAFFFVLGCAVMLAAWLAMRLMERPARWADLLSHRPPHAIRDFGVAAAVFALAMVPFLYIYLPALRGTGGRSFPEIEAFIHSFREVCNVSPTNMIWGGLMARIYDAPMYRIGEVNRGFTPISVIVAAVTGCLSLRAWTNRRLRVSVLLIGVSCLTLYALSVSFFQWTLWWAVYAGVPGGSAIRVPNRVNHLIALGIAVLCAMALQALLDRAKHWRRFPRAAGVAASAVLACFLLLEQADTRPTALISRTAERRLFGAIPSPPSACRDFFLVNPRVGDPAVVGMVDAMLIAREKNLPTVDGYSGWTPPGWHLYNFEGDVAAKAEAYAEQRGIRQGLCQFDETANRWSVPPPGAGAVP